MTHRIFIFGIAILTFVCISNHNLFASTRPAESYYEESLSAFENKDYLKSIINLALAVEKTSPSGIANLEKYSMCMGISLAKQIEHRSTIESNLKKEKTSIPLHLSFLTETLRLIDCLDAISRSSCTEEATDAMLSTYSQKTFCLNLTNLIYLYLDGDQAIDMKSFHTLLDNGEAFLDLDVLSNGYSDTLPIKCFVSGCINLARACLFLKESKERAGKFIDKAIEHFENALNAAEALQESAFLKKNNIYAYFQFTTKKSFSIAILDKMVRSMARSQELKLEELERVGEVKLKRLEEVKLKRLAEEQKSKGFLTSMEKMEQRTPQKEHHLAAIKAIALAPEEIISKGIARLSLDPDPEPLVKIEKIEQCTLQQERPIHAIKPIAPAPEKIISDKSYKNQFIAFNQIQYKPDNLETRAQLSDAFFADDIDNEHAILRSLKEKEHGTILCEFRTIILKKMCLFYQPRNTLADQSAWDQYATTRYGFTQENAFFRLALENQERMLVFQEINPDHYSYMLFINACHILNEINKAVQQLKANEGLSNTILHLFTDIKSKDVASIKKLLNDHAQQCGILLKAAISISITKNKPAKKLWECIMAKAHCNAVAREIINAA